MTYKRNRLQYGLMVLVVIILGLCSRRMSNLIPGFLNTYLGDALWALMIFFTFGFIFRTIETKKVALIAIAFCYFIELSQLYHTSWIDSIRKTTIGGLVLGYAFLWSDLLAYAIGIGVGVIMELFLFKN
ncbi:DUF2809 domain-containing protein [Clostridium aciditolerans]|uniref:DUF2809 domain-containing protein n=1 Tax=Clostridium aciditolerans TaxID=339861 RepID=A0A934M200_9CLOT|nr:DUF2809 domain-containing protein [Clostridium aciditolerans]MBI6871632.1 DUF2809 domain-containing protein [Clostridium aciditolerans]